MITYENKSDKTVVKIDGKVVGHIYRVAGGFQYDPKDSNMRGKTLNTIDDVKRQLESD